MSTTRALTPEWLTQVAADTETQLHDLRPRDRVLMLDDYVGNHPGHRPGLIGDIWGTGSGMTTIRGDAVLTILTCPDGERSSHSGRIVATLNPVVQEGDRVVVLDVNDSTVTPHPNAPGTVIGMRGDRLRVRFDTPVLYGQDDPRGALNVDTWVRAVPTETAQVAEIERAFQVGDLVDVAADATTTSGGGVYFGGAVRGRIMRAADRNGDIFVRREPHNGGVRDQVVAPRWLTLREPVGPEPVSEPMRAFRVGDLVDVSADATTAGGTGVYFGGATRGRVVGAADSAGNVTVQGERAGGGAIEQTVGQQWLTLVTEPVAAPTFVPMAEGVYIPPEHIVRSGQCNERVCQRVITHTNVDMIGTVYAPWDGGRSPFYSDNDCQVVPIAAGFNVPQSVVVRPDPGPGPYLRALRWQDGQDVAVGDRVTTPGGEGTIQNLDVIRQDRLSVRVDYENISVRMVDLQRVARTAREVRPFQVGDRVRVIGGAEAHIYGNVYTGQEGVVAAFHGANSDREVREFPVVVSMENGGRRFFKESGLMLVTATPEVSEFQVGPEKVISVARIREVAEAYHGETSRESIQALVEDVTRGGWTFRTEVYLGDSYFDYGVVNPDGDVIVGCPTMAAAIEVLDHSHPVSEEPVAESVLRARMEVHRRRSRWCGVATRALRDVLA